MKYILALAVIVGGSSEIGFLAGKRAADRWYAEHAPRPQTYLLQPGQCGITFNEQTILFNAKSDGTCDFEAAWRLMGMGRN